jgi:catechol 2,3-dioxygenase-like lactoylglutathione lyase family enzyme
LRFVRTTLDTPADRLESVRRFYAQTLELPARPDADRGRAAFDVGETVLEFRASASTAFYHFAFLVPGDRFDAAHRWAASRTTLLPDDETGRDVFDFDSWHALACYFEDPAGNIVELIAHRDLEWSGETGGFHGRELLGASELGLVGDPVAMARALESETQLHVWDGTLDEPGRLAFVGERGRTLILAPAERGWLPTGRPAEAHHVEVEVAAEVDATVDLEDGQYRLVSRAL